MLPDPLYTPISSDDFYAALEGKDIPDWVAYLRATWMNFTPSELNDLAVFGPVTYPFGYYTSTPSPERLAVHQAERIASFAEICGRKVFKLIDEWYYVYQSSQTYYRCDTFEGLIQCLTTLIPASV